MNCWISSFVSMEFFLFSDTPSSPCCSWRHPMLASSLISFSWSISYRRFAVIGMAGVPLRGPTLLHLSSAGDATGWFHSGWLATGSTGIGVEHGVRPSSRGEGESCGSTFFALLLGRFFLFFFAFFAVSPASSSASSCSIAVGPPIADRGILGEVAIDSPWKRPAREGRASRTGGWHPGAIPCLRSTARSKLCRKAKQLKYINWSRLSSSVRICSQMNWSRCHNMLPRHVTTSSCAPRMHVV